MIAITQTKSIPVFDLGGKRFREDHFSFSPICTLVFQNKSYMKPYTDLVIVTEDLDTGSYGVDLKVVDDYNNESIVKGDMAHIKNYLLEPYNFLVSVVGNDVTLSWNSDNDSYNYAIWGNKDGTEIDKSGSPLSVPSFSPTTLTVADGDWVFTIDSYTGSYVSNNSRRINVTVPSSDDIPNPPDDGEDGISWSGIFLKSVDTGKVRISFYWEYGSVASAFRVYHDSGTGTINYGSYLSFANSGEIFQEFTTPQIYEGAVPKIYKFVLQSESSDGVLSEYSREYNIQILGVKPPAISEVFISE